MVKYIFLVPLLALVITWPTDSSAGPFQKTEDLVWACSGKLESLQDAMNFGMCAGYIDGMLEMHSIMRDLFGAKTPFCLPKRGISVDQAMKVFLKWAEDNPQDMHETARSSVLISLKLAFPCSG